MSAATPPPADPDLGQALWSGRCDWRELVEDLHLHYASRPRKPGGQTGPRSREKSREPGPATQRF